MADDHETQPPDVQERAPGSSPTPYRDREDAPEDAAGDGILAPDRGIEDPRGAGAPPDDA